MPKVMKLRDAEIVKFRVRVGCGVADVGTEVALMLSAHPLMAMVVGKGM